MCNILIFTGFLGSGKTTLILSLLPLLPPSYKVCIIKNEYGDNQVDSLLYKQSNVAVKEYINGCLCCILVGQLEDALLELKAAHQPDCIIIETSGSALPAPLVLQINKLPKEFNFYVETVVNVIDCVEFRGYSDKSFTAQLQSKYTDLVLLNKWEGVEERTIDGIVDEVLEMNGEVAVLKYWEGLDWSVVCSAVGGDLLKESKEKRIRNWMNSDGDAGSVQHFANAVQVLQINVLPKYDLEQLKQRLNEFKSDCVYRIKGIISSENGIYILNYGFGRYTLTECNEQNLECKLSVIGSDLQTSWCRNSLCKLLNFTPENMIRFQ